MKITNFVCLGAVLPCGFLATLYWSSSSDLSSQHPACLRVVTSREEGETFFSCLEAVCEELEPPGERLSDAFTRVGVELYDDGGLRYLNSAAGREVVELHRARVGPGVIGAIDVALEAPVAPLPPMQDWLSDAPRLAETMRNVYQILVVDAWASQLEGPDIRTRSLGRLVTFTVLLAKQSGEDARWWIVKCARIKLSISSIFELGRRLDSGALQALLQKVDGVEVGRAMVSDVIRREYTLCLSAVESVSARDSLRMEALRQISEYYCRAIEEGESVGRVSLGVEAYSESRSAVVEEMIHTLCVNVDRMYELADTTQMWIDMHVLLLARELHVQRYGRKPASVADLEKIVGRPVRSRVEGVEYKINESTGQVLADGPAGRKVSVP